MMTPADILIAARAAVLLRGWRQGGNLTGQGDKPCCMVAGVAIAGQWPPKSHAPTERALAFLAKVIRRHRSQIPEWNDEPGRTEAEVMAAYDRAIDLARAA